MATPKSFSRTTSFTNSFAASPTQVFPGAALDVELNNIKTTLDQLIANSLLIQRDDGALANGVVGSGQLSPALQVGFAAPTVWASATGYFASPASTVFNGNKFYSCLKSHTSSSNFATDLAAGDWVLIADLSGVALVTAAQIAVTPTGHVTATDVQSAFAQIDSIKLQTATFNALTASQITDSTADGRTLLTEALAAQRNTLGGPQIGDIKHTARIQIDSGWLWADGTAYNRGARPGLLAAITVGTTGTTNGTTTISAVPIDLRFLGLEGAVIEGSNISAGATISSVTSTTIVITGSISDSASGKALTLFPYGNGDGSTTFNVPKYNGTTLVARDNQNGTVAGLVGTVVTDVGTIVGSRLNSQGGSSTHVQSAGELRAHTHGATVTDTHTHQTVATGSGKFIGGAASTTFTVAAGTAALTAGSDPASLSTSITNAGSITVANATVGSSTAMSWMQPSTMCNVWIFAGP